MLKYQKNFYPETNAQLEKEQDERRNRDLYHAQELKKQLETDKAKNSKAGQKLQEVPMTQEGSITQEEPVAGVVQEAMPAAELTPVTKTTSKKTGKKSSKKNKKQAKQPVVETSSAAPLVKLELNR